jgi:hypothetical protein
MGAPQRRRVERHAYRPHRLAKNHTSASRLISALSPGMRFPKKGKARRTRQGL